MKKLLLLLLCFILLLTACAPGVKPPAEGPAVPMTVKSLPIPQVDGQDWKTINRMVAQYTDNGQRIPMGTYYDETFWVTVPQAYADREIEVILTEEVNFPDYDETVWQFYSMGIAVNNGLIAPRFDGSAAPMEKMTWEEAAAAAFRLLGLTVEDPMAALTEYDLTADMPDITPDASITREGFIALCVRVLALGGLMTMEDATAEEVAAATETWSYNDAADISPWALSAYKAAGTRAISDYLETDKTDESGIPLYEVFLLPQQELARWEAVQVLENFRYDVQHYPSRLAMEYGFDQAMPVIDGSTSTYPFTEAVYRSLFHNGYTHPNKPLKHSKSHASYQRLINGEVDVIFASVYPHRDILQMAADAGVELELIPIAYDAMVFFTNAENSIKGLTKEQITQIYVNDAYENWQELGGPDAQFVPYCRNNDSGSHSQMERHFLGDNPIHENIAPETSMSMSDVLTDVMSVPHRIPGAYGLGYSIYYYFHNMNMFYGTLTELKLLEIDGVAPTDETIASGEYPLSNNTYLAMRKDIPEDHPARKLAEFMLTLPGQRCVAEAGFGPLDPAAAERT